MLELLSGELDPPLSDELDPLLSDELEDSEELVLLLSLASFISRARFLVP